MKTGVLLTELFDAKQGRCLLNFNGFHLLPPHLMPHILRRINLPMHVAKIKTYPFGGCTASFPKLLRRLLALFLDDMVNIIWPMVKTMIH